MAFSVQPGTWTIAGQRLPDFNITETAARLLGQNPTNFNNALGTYAKAASYVNPILGMSFQNNNQYSQPTQPNPTTNTTNTNVKVLGLEAPPVTTSTAGGGGSTSKTTQTQTSDPTQQTGDTSQIDSVYNDASNILNNQESYLRSMQPDFENQVNQQFASQLPYLDQSKTAQLGAINNANTQATTQKENALAQARRLFDEQSRGFQQRFGGSSSAGMAANQLNARESQRQFGQVQQNYANTQAELNQKAVDVENYYQAQVVDLNAKKEAALSQARAEFQTKLAQINDARFGLAQNKAQAKLNLLAEFRNRAYQIEDEVRQYSQQLDLMRQQHQYQIQEQAKAMEAFNKQLGGQIGGTINNQVQSNAGAITPLAYGANADQSGQTIMGQINPNLRKLYGLA